MTESTSPSVQFLATALARVESVSIRDWAKSEQNYPIWVKLAEKALEKKTDVQMFIAYIVSTAIGL